MRWTAAVMTGLAACTMVASGAHAQTGMDSVSVCVIRDGELRQEHHPRTSDTTWSHRTPDPGPGYVSNEAFYINNEPIRFGRRMFVKYGLPRVMEIGEVRRVGRYRGASVFTDREESVEDPLVLYLPVRPGCEFQPYQTEAITLGVRG